MKSEDNLCQQAFELQLPHLLDLEKDISCIPMASMIGGNQLYLTAEYTFPSVNPSVFWIKDFGLN